MEAVKRIYNIKGRSDKKSLIILLDTTSKLDTYVSPVPEIALDLIRIADKPLTIIFEGARQLAGNLVGPDGSVAVRIIRDPFCEMLIRRLGKPIVSTSANQSGLPWPSTFSQIDASIIHSVDYVVRWRQSEKTKGKPSGIIRVGPDGTIKIIRE